MLGDIERRRKSILFITVHEGDIRQKGANGVLPLVTIFTSHSTSIKKEGEKILVEDDTHVNIRNTVVRADVLCCRQIASREQQLEENTRKWLQMCQRT